MKITLEIILNNIFGTTVPIINYCYHYCIDSINIPLLFTIIKNKSIFGFFEVIELHPQPISLSIMRTA